MTYKLTPALIDRLVKDYEFADLEPIIQEYGFRNAKHLRGVAQQLREMGVPIPNRDTSGYVKLVVQQWKKDNEKQAIPKSN